MIGAVTRYLRSILPGILGYQGPYRAGEVHRLNKTWQPQHYTAETALAEAWDLLVRRSRDLGRNDPVMTAILNAMVDHVIGIGIQTSAAVRITDDYEDDFNEEADEAWEWWSENEADAAGRLSWPDLQRQAFRECLESGDAFLLRIAKPDPDRLVPLCYQVLEGEQLDTSMDERPAAGRNEIIRGIEVNGAGEPVAYWLFDRHPSDPHSLSGFGNSTRVPAERVIHLYLPGRPSALHGTPLPRASIAQIRDLDNYLGSELTSAIIASLLTVVHKTSATGTGFGFTGDGTDQSSEDLYGNRKVKLGRGIVCQIPREDSVEAVKVERPNSGARTFVDLMLQLVGMGSNLSRTTLTRDYVAMTYIAARMAKMDDKAAFRPLQRFVGRNLVAPVRREWTLQMAAYGRFRSVSPRLVAAAKRRWLALDIHLSGTEPIDPEKETDSDIASVGAGMDTLENICARRHGKPWRKILRQRSREIAYAASLNPPVVLNYDRPSTPAKPQQPGYEAPAREE